MVLAHFKERKNRSSKISNKKCVEGNRRRLKKRYIIRRIGVSIEDARNQVK